MKKLNFVEVGVAKWHTGRADLLDCGEMEIEAIWQHNDGTVWISGILEAMEDTLRRGLGCDDECIETLRKEGWETKNYWGEPIFCVPVVWELDGNGDLADHVAFGDEVFALEERWGVQFCGIEKEVQA